MAMLRMSKDEADIAGWYFTRRLLDRMRGPEWSVSAFAVVSEAQIRLIESMSFTAVKITNRCRDIECWNAFDGIEISDGE